MKCNEFIPTVPEDEKMFDPAALFPKELIVMIVFEDFSGVVQRMQTSSPRPGLSISFDRCFLILFGQVGTPVGTLQVGPGRSFRMTSGRCYNVACYILVPHTMR